MNSVQDARINKTNAFWKDRLQFLKDLDAEIKQLSKRADAAGFKFAVRLNGTSDLPWYRYKVDGKNLMQLILMSSFMIIQKYLTIWSMELKTTMLSIHTVEKIILNACGRYVRG